jgi:2',3'-cyclic-nucleotide 2'-phosphodiesterase (5'-nucleotidase family)
LLKCGSGPLFRTFVLIFFGTDIQVTAMLKHIFLLLCFSPISWASQIPIHVYHTNDLHSHFEGFKVPALNSKKYERRGGFDRMALQIQKIRERAKSEGGISFGVDGGDFFAGTVFSAIAPSKEKDFPEFEFLHENGFELVTLGNHEFDAMNVGLAVMLEKASRTGLPIVSSNIEVANPKSILYSFLGPEKVIRPYLVKSFESKTGSLKIGFLGALGPDGCLVSRATREDVRFVGFNDHKSKLQLKELARHLQSHIRFLRESEKVDLVVLSIHGGGREAVELAERLAGLDLLIAGHTHKKEFKIVNGTIVTQTGSYSENLGHLNLVFDQKSRRLSLADEKSDHYIAIDDKLPASEYWTKKITDWRKQSLSIMGLSPTAADEVVFTPKKDYITGRQLFNPMGLFVASLIHDQLNLSHQAKIDFYFTSAGLIRESFYKDVPYTQSELFNIFSVGFDDQQKPGVDVVAFYLTSKEVRKLIHFLELYSHFSGTFSPVTSEALSYRVRPWGIPFINRVADLNLNGRALDKVEGLVKVATNRFVAKNIDTLSKLSYGFVTIEPKDQNGNLITRYETFPKEYQLLIESLKRNKNEVD